MIEHMTDWFYIKKKNTLKSRIRNFFSFANKRLCWYFMLLSRNPYPIGRSSKDFKISCFLGTVMAINVVYNIVYACFNAKSLSSMLLCIATILLATFATIINVGNMLKLKYLLYIDKVEEISDDFTLPYAMAQVKLAAAYPSLELDKNWYEEKFRRQKKIFDAISRLQTLFK